MKMRLSVVCFVLMCATVAWSQDVPRVEVAGGYSFLRDAGLGTNANGVFVSPTRNLVHWFGLTGDLQMNDGELNVGNASKIRITSFLGGASFAYRQKETIVPFVRVLAGATHRRRAFAAGADSDINGTFQMGGGVDYWFREKIGIRFGADYRHFSASNQYGFRVGVVWRSDDL